MQPPAPKINQNQFILVSLTPMSLKLGLTHLFASLDFINFKLMFFLILLSINFKI